MRRLLGSLILLLIFSGIKMHASEFPKIDIPYTKFVLSNGLTLLVHEDHKAPIVAVNIWYHVGSKNEKPGKTGFAHLFEHLMFNGSEHFDDDYFQALERLGATDLNGTTSEDRTNYFQNVPTSGLDAVLWLESDRMGHLIKAVTQGKLDEQRGVVQNEKRQGENEPYSLAYELIAKNTYPVGHPYSWTVIGSMEDLNAAKLEDVHEWFRTYYGPSNATLVVAGDITPAEAKAKVEKYFGDIPPGPPLTRPQYWVAKMTGEKRDVAQDRVPQAKYTKVWNVPQRNADEAVYLDLLSDVLSSGKTSRLYKRLVYEEQIATNVNTYIDARELSSQFYVEALLKPGVPMEKVEKAINEEMAKLFSNGITAKEMERVKTGYFAAFVRGIERIGGFGGKSDILAQNQVFAGDPEAYKADLELVKNATAEKIVSVGKTWLSDGAYILEIYPYPEMEAATAGADRSKMPEMDKTADAKFVQFEKRELSNGLKVIIANRKTIPVVNFNLMINAGFSADHSALPGTANLTMDMLDEGTKTRDALTLSEDLALLGANLRTGASLDYCNVSLSALKNKLDESLDLFTDVLLNPSFPQKELDRLKKEKIAQINREKSSPVQMGMRAFPKLLFGEGHAYSLPFSGLGYEETISKLKVSDLEKFRDTWFKPNNATLIVVGDVTADEIVAKLEKLLKPWKKGTVPVKNIAEVKNAATPKIYILDKPGSVQSVILAGSVIPKKGEDEIAIVTMDNILGGVFTSRINMNLREDKHWSYGSGSSIINTQAQRPYLFYGMIQGDKTKESLQEMFKEIKGMITDKPATDEEIDKIKKNQILQLAGSWETAGRVAGSLVEMVSYNLPDNYFNEYAGRVQKLSKEEIQAAAKKTLMPNNLVWVVVGDRSKIEAGLKEIGYEVNVINGDGKVIK